MAPTAFEKAEAERTSIKDHLNLLELAVNDHINGRVLLTRQEAENFKVEAEEERKNVVTNHTLLRTLAAKTVDMSQHIADFYELSKQANRVSSALHGIIMSFGSSTPPPPPTVPTSGSHQHIKLPRLEIPKFSGNLQEWVSFRDMYVTAIHTNSSLSKVEKFTQLKTLLTGEANRQVRSLLLTEANYDIAWDSLIRRYENNRELLFSIMKRLHGQPALTTGTAVGIRSLIDTTMECVRSLEVLAIPIQQWDANLLYLLFTKLDTHSRELWESTLPDTGIPKLEKLYEFMEQRARALAASGVPPQRQTQGKPQQPAKAHHASTTCKLGCSQPHPVFKCSEFQKKTPAQRLQEVKRLQLCINCLGEGHVVSSCHSKHTCKICHRNHNTLLHDENIGGRRADSSASINQDEKTVRGNEGASAQSHYSNSSFNVATGILATAWIRLHSQTVTTNRRALVDGGSTNTQITRKTAKQLGLPLRPINVPMTGPGGVDCGLIKHVTTFKFSPHFNENIILTATALVVDKVSGCIPSHQLNPKDWPHLHGLQYADPQFDKPKEVEVLLGTDIVWSILQNEKIQGQHGQPLGIKTTLGWLIAGPNNERENLEAFTYNSIVDLDATLRRFWEQEESNKIDFKSKEEVVCEEKFAKEHTRDPTTGRFTVTLPFKHEVPELGASREQAVRRFLSLERKYNHPHRKSDEEKQKLQQQWEMYKQFMEEYKILQHMEHVPPEEVNIPGTYYIPHHAVFKDSSTTTKLRVVFDASAITSNGTSLNEHMMTGPQLQDSIWEVMLRFRIHPIAFTADIAKMYRQIRVIPSHTNLQRIVWREKPTDPIRDYRLLTVTYGTTSAPYLAVKCLQQLAKDEEHRFPAGAQVALKNFYVDDVASSCPTLEEAIETVQQLRDLCMSGGFELRKWTTNSKELLSTIPESLRETSPTIELQQDTTIKTLGIFWNHSEDMYTFKLSIPLEMKGNKTKRNVLSEIAKIFDPLGWVAPAIIVCKVFMQELWKLKHDWDDTLPEAVQNYWIDLRTSLFDLEHIKIPRCVLPSTPSRLFLVGCSDASTKAISACVYLAAEYNDQSTSCYLLTSKTKVAPVKAVTLPRLELNGAVLLSELLNSTLKAIQLPIQFIRAFVDSTITLHWIQSCPSRWKTYVRNRVQTIQDNVPDAKWFHLSGERNPADCASRGVSSSELLNHPFWWNGVTEFFTAEPLVSELLEHEITLMEQEQTAMVHHLKPVSPLPSFLTKFSSYTRLERVMAYVLRFINHCKNGRTNSFSNLNVEELRKANTIIMKLLQHHFFASEIASLSSKQQLPASSSLLSLNPFISADGLLRVGGRLRNSSLPFSQRHPVLLPRNHHITETLVRQYHLSTLHGGATITLASLQRNYWIVSGRNYVRAVIRKCVTCIRHRGEMLQQIMADLPPHRVNQSRPFSRVGVDYAGPIVIKPMIRSRVTLKSWLAVFVCMATRAIHIEVVSSLSTECFLAAFRRFISRRGKPSDIYSDCGTNFKGADKVLNDFLISEMASRVTDESSNAGISWHFNPPGAPHFGGLWEAGVKSIKHHLVRVLGSGTLTYEEMLTLVTQIEGILNSRPLTPASTDPSDLCALTPAHFLIGGPITSAPEPDLQNVKLGYLQRWQLLQQQQQLFWKRWSSEYLTRLQQRPKWMKVSSELQPGQMVIIKEERLPPLHWKLARVLEVHPGKDGHVRVATLKTLDGEIKRPIVKLSLLPII